MPQPICPQLPLGQTLAGMDQRLARRHVLEQLRRHGGGVQGGRVLDVREEDVAVAVDLEDLLATQVAREGEVGCSGFPRAVLQVLALRSVPRDHELDVGEAARDIHEDAEPLSLADQADVRDRRGPSRGSRRRDEAVQHFRRHLVR